jgi:leucyl-tRNA synthetase
MFMGPFTAVKPWSQQGIRGVSRFLQRVWQLQEKVKGISCPLPLEKLRHKLIKKITNDIETYNFNTAVSTFMETVNMIAREEFVPKVFWRTFLILLKPFAPHLAEELWSRLGHEKNMTVERWPNYNEALIKEDKVELIVQVNGKLRDRIKVPADSQAEEVKKIALTSEKIKKYVSGEPKKVIFVPNRLINFVI